MKNIKNYIKRMTAVVLAMGMLVAGIVVAPKQADATSTVVIPDKVIYQEYDNATTFWSEETKTAPEMDGYVFGGWFKDVTQAEITDKTETFEDNGTTTYYEPLTQVTDSAYAKFVPAQVLSVKAQNESKATKDFVTNLNLNWTEGQTKDYFWVRVMTSLDSKNYQKIGFEIYLANQTEPLKKNGNPLETSRYYEAVEEEVNGEMTTQSASSIFGASSKYLCVWQLSKIDTASNATKKIYVRPYWYTADGTKVFGLAKYVHIEDEYEGYISVPVNIATAKDIAAGSVTMSYDGLELAKDSSGNVLFETGRMFSTMQFNPSETDKRITMLGYESTVGTNSKSGETIFANVRFKKPSTSATLEFDMNLGRFCDWNEKIWTNGTDVKVWDIAYEVKATVSE